MLDSFKPVALFPDLSAPRYSFCSPCSNPNDRMEVNPELTLSAGELGGFGFTLARKLLVILTIFVGAMLSLFASLSYFLVMDVSVDGIGSIETRRRFQVKSAVVGIIEEIGVGYGQLVDEGAIVAILDRREVRANLLKVETDIEQNEGARAAVLETIRKEWVPCHPQFQEPRSFFPPPCQFEEEIGFLDIL